ncbi:MAG: Gldg family protein [Pontiellaceae bacterium]
MIISQKNWNKLNISIRIVITFLIICLLFYFSSLYYFRYDFNKNSNYYLASRSISVVKSLTNTIKITIIINDDNYLINDIDNLLAEYLYHSDLIEVSWIDPFKNPAFIEQLSIKYGVNSYPSIIIDNKIDYRIINEKQLRDLDFKTNKMVSFNGEQAITSSLMELQKNIKPKVYFIYGNGEKRLNDVSQNGYSSLIPIFTKDTIDLESFELNGYESIPEDASAIILPGPKRTLNKSSISIIEEYLNRSGRVMVLIDAFYDTGLDDMLRRWGISTPKGAVFDQAQTLRGRDVNVNNFGAHSINEGVQSVVKLIFPSPIIPISLKKDSDIPVDLPNVTTLLRSSNNSWIETSSSLKIPVYNEASGDLFGPIQLALAIEKGSLKELDLEIKPSRMVVIGDSEFISNGNLIDGNKDFFMKSINWLLDRKSVTNISSKKINNIKIAISEKIFLRYFIISLILIPLIPIIFCVIIMAWRKSK